MDEASDSAPAPEVNHLDFAKTSFMESAARFDQCPADSGWEVAFAGRSNSGKSSAINALTRQKKLARTSRTPGRTQLINFFNVGDQQRLVDLPGYGYAKVPQKVKNAWNRQLEKYLQRRESLRGLILLSDCRHPLHSFDQQMLSWAAQAHMPVHLLLTKADKLSKGAAKQALFSVQGRLSPWANLISCQLFSARVSQGLDELEAKLNDWLTDASVT